MKNFNQFSGLSNFKPSRLVFFEGNPDKAPEAQSKNPDKVRDKDRADLEKRRDEVLKKYDSDELEVNSNEKIKSIFTDKSKLDAYVTMRRSELHAIVEPEEIYDSFDEQLDDILSDEIYHLLQSFKDDKVLLKQIVDENMENNKANIAANALRMLFPQKSGMTEEEMAYVQGVASNPKVNSYVKAAASELLSQ